MGVGRVPEGRTVFEEAFEKEKAEWAGFAPQHSGLFASDARSEESDAAAEAEANRAMTLGEGRGGQRRALQSAKGRRGGALEDADAALATKVKDYGPRADLIPLLARGEALLQLHRAAEGLEDLERALALADATSGDRAIRADVRFATARAIVAVQGDAARARALATRARGELDSEQMPAAANKVAAWLAANGLAQPG